MKTVYEVGIYNADNECDEIVAANIESEMKMKDILNQTKQRKLAEGQYINVLKERVEQNGEMVYLGTWNY